MATGWFGRETGQGRDRAARRKRPASVGSRIESLEGRAVPATFGLFDPSASMLFIIGDAQDNTIEVGRDPTDTIRVNDGAVPVFGGVPTVENTALVLVFGLGGDDVVRVDEANGAMPSAVIFGGDGDDELSGGSGADTFFAGAGDDSVDGNRGADVAFLGTGNDAFTWDPGDGSDRIEGEGGDDLLRFNGSGADEVVDMSADRDRLRFARTVGGTVVMDTDGVERVDFNALGGADSVTVRDLSATDVREVAINLEGSPGGEAGDGESDRVNLLGTSGPDSVEVTGSMGVVTALDLPARVTITSVEPDDGLIVATLEGNDLITASTLETSVNFTADGGAGSDQIEGSDLAETLIGGSGDDIVVGQRGNDVAVLGDGRDTFVWDPGDGSDVVEGGGGRDRMVFNGSNADEVVEVSDDDGRVRFVRTVNSPVIMDLDDVEQIDFAAFGGADKVTVDDVSETDLVDLNVNLSAIARFGTPDEQPDEVAVVGTERADAIRVTPNGSFVEVGGLAATVRVRNADPTLDLLRVDARGGGDEVDARRLPGGVIGLHLSGGAGDDSLNGSDGDDTLDGGSGDDELVGERGDDIAFLGDGDDVFVWDPGDGSDVVEGEAGADALVFNGSGADEVVDISNDGGRARFSRTVSGTVVMDLDDVERIAFAALGGADDVTINDLTGTDLIEVDIDLAGDPTTGVGDGKTDRVVVNGGSGDDAITASSKAGGVVVDGLHAAIRVSGADGPGDLLALHGLGGDDRIDASGLTPGEIRVVADGGDGDDTVIGSEGDDILFGGEGDDRLFALGGDDIAFGGGGDDAIDGGDGVDVLFGGLGDDEFKDGEIVIDP